MIYIIGILGFIGGFLIGQVFLFIKLQQRSNDELMDDKGLHWTYGTLNWIIAFSIMAGCMSLYHRWFMR